MARMLTLITIVAALLAVAAGPAVAHPHEVTTGNGDGCYATAGDPQDNNPAID